MSGWIKAVVSKIAALAILVGLLSGMANWIVRPLSGRFFDAQDRITEQRGLLGRLALSAATDKDIAAVEGRNGTGSGTRTFLPGETDAVRSAGLQSMLNETAEAAGVRLASTRALDPTVKAGLRLLSVEAQLSANLDQLQKILSDLEKQHPNLVIGQLHIARSPQARGQGLPALDVNLTLTGATPPLKEGP